MLVMAMMSAMLCAAAEDTGLVLVTEDAAESTVKGLTVEGETAVPSEVEIPIGEPSPDGVEDAPTGNESKPEDFEIEDGVLVKYVGPGGDVVIPDGVTSIGEKAFQSDHSVTSVTIPNSVTSIGRGAFWACISLTSVKIPDGVTSIGEKAFTSTSLTSVTIPDSVTSIGRGAFDTYCTMRSVTAGSGASIDDLFSSGVLDGKVLAEINVTKYNFAYTSKDGVLYTHDMTTLLRCPRTKTSVTVGAGVSFDVLLNSYIFECKALKAIYVTEGNTAYASRDGVLYTSDLRTLLRCPRAKKSVNIPDSVTQIGKKAFYFCGELTSVTLPESVTSIDEKAFFGCGFMTMAAIPDSVTSIGAEAFKNCYSLTIYGNICSYAEKYAQENGIPFKPFGGEGDLIEMSECTITVEDQVYTGKKLTPRVTVKYINQTLKEGTDYTVTYRNNKAIGTATATVKGKGGFTGKAEVTFRIDPKKVAGLKLAPGKGKIEASWKKAPGGVTGYQLEYGLKKDFTGAETVTVKKGNAVNRTLKGLSSGKTYYVRVRAYKKVDKETFISEWSSA